MDELKKRRRELLYSVKSRAKELGLPFNLRDADVEIPERCPVLDIPLKFNNEKSGPDSPSIDRIRPEHGYVRGNVRVISMRANALKSNGKPEELLRVALYAWRHTAKSTPTKGHIFLRGCIWWCAFSRQGKEFRVTSHSRNKSVAEALLQKLTGAKPEQAKCNRCGGPGLIQLRLCLDCLELI